MIQPKITTKRFLKNFWKQFKLLAFHYYNKKNLEILGFFLFLRRKFVQNFQKYELKELKLSMKKLLNSKNIIALFSINYTKKILLTFIVLLIEKITKK